MTRRRWREACLAGFNRWFSSGAGVWQTFALSVAVTVAEVTWPAVDPNGFRWLYLCTVWSFFTQNALAYSSRQDGEKVEATLRKILREERRIEHESRTR